jgi:uncharacterized membrane protein
MSDRLLGVDAARGTALLGMVAVHVLPPTDPDGSRSLVDLVASGRSAATFAVLAGVGVALATGGRRPPGAQERARSRVALLVRALLLGLVGLALGSVESGLAVILAYYAVLFVVAAAVLGVRPARLAGAALAVAVVVPVVSFLVRDALPDPDRANPTFAALAEPAELLGLLLITGYYPALAWTAYLLVGLAVGRLQLGWTRVAAGIALTGALLALLAEATSAFLLRVLGGYERLAEVERVPPGRSIVDLASANQFGNVPTSSPWWLAVDAPHSSTPPDLVATTGTALLVLGLALLLAPRAAALVRPLAALGAMPLTLYTVHVLTVAAVQTDDPLTFYLAQIAVGTGAALLWRRYVGRGPLEAVLAAASRAATAPLRPART